MDSEDLGKDILEDIKNYSYASTYAGIIIFLTVAFGNMGNFLSTLFDSVLGLPLGAWSNPFYFLCSFASLLYLCFLVGRVSLIDRFIEERVGIKGYLFPGLLRIFIFSGFLGGTVSWIYTVGISWE